MPRREVMCRVCRKIFKTYSSNRHECEICKPKATHKGMRENYVTVHEDGNGDVIETLHKPVVDRINAAKHRKKSKAKSTTQEGR